MFFWALAAGAGRSAPRPRGRCARPQGVGDQPVLLDPPGGRQLDHVAVQALDPVAGAARRLLPQLAPVLIGRQGRDNLAVDKEEGADTAEAPAVPVER